MYARLPRCPWRIRLGFGGDPSKLPTVTASLPHLRRPPSLPHPSGRHGLVCGRFLPHSGISVTQVRHAPSAEPFPERVPESCGARRLLLCPKNRTHPLADPQRKVPPLSLAHHPQQPGLPPGKSGEMAGLLANACSEHLPPFQPPLGIGQRLLLLC